MCTICEDDANLLLDLHSEKKAFDLQNMSWTKSYIKLPESKITLVAFSVLQQNGAKEKLIFYSINLIQVLTAKLADRKNFSTHIIELFAIISSTKKFRYSNSIFFSSHMRSWRRRQHQQLSMVIYTNVRSGLERTRLITKWQNVPWKSFNKSPFTDCQRIPRGKPHESVKVDAMLGKRLIVFSFEKKKLKYAKSFRF